MADKNKVPMMSLTSHEMVHYNDGSEDREVKTTPPVKVTAQSPKVYPAYTPTPTTLATDGSSGTLKGEAGGSTPSDGDGHWSGH